MIVIIALFIAIVLTPHPVYAVTLAISDPLIHDTAMTVTASVSGATSNYYLQGVLRAADSSKYFGETKNGRGDWIDYLASPEKEFITSNFYVTDVREASWSGNVDIRFKLDDPNYKGPGTYELKLKRFTGASSSAAGESNTITVTLSAAAPSPSPSPAIPSPQPSPLPSPTLASPESSVPSVTPSPHASASPGQTPRAEGQEGTVAGVADIDLSAFGVTPSPSPTAHASPQLEINKDKARIAILVGIGLAMISAATYGILRYLHKL